MNPMRSTPNVLLSSSGDAAATGSLMSVRIAGAWQAATASYRETMRTGSFCVRGLRRKRLGCGRRDIIILDRREHSFGSTRERYTRLEWQSGPTLTTLHQSAH